jgi:ERO1-like protein alpha
LSAGVATALKILFSSRDCSGELPHTSQLPFGQDLVLERNEVIALVNLLGRFSHSLDTYHRLTAELQRQEGVARSIADKAAVV